MTAERPDDDRLVVFDLDGTVVDSTRVLLGAHDVAWASVGLQRPDDGTILELIGLPLLDTMRILGPEQDAEALAEVYSRAYVEIAPRYERLFDGIAELLERPFRAAVATGKSQRGADRVVQQFGLGDRFEIVLGGNSVPRPKPNPDLLEAIMEATGTGNLVMVGDTTYDLEMAHTAGVAAIGVSWGHHPADRLREWAPVVDTVEELGRLLGV
ncbi:MAG: HAD-IA family hydrolase [Myxococcota bacterium]|nr:HAD-IA family hydrolase [Myxococcota bacterium]